MFFIGIISIIIYVRLCRKSDPESKGRVEAVVKYMKNNFAKNRYYMDLRT